ncbi:hypothetical protein ASPTUDRAFT_40407 [Aspergillus tubingensis CBS 134.48]|uniref:Uncharacterized protein n=1 Tax=Aspergillus tubingensis (strain CBS 134.48) TaxID=767770 RepID=A0A1L9NDJ4_ASPTC|nr:hypothetical protein ASPTUDRAFT_40407 [Aspergillus tubingensis CBS 134.48]
MKPWLKRRKCGSGSGASAWLSSYSYAKEYHNLVSVKKLAILPIKEILPAGSMPHYSRKIFVTDITQNFGWDSSEWQCLWAQHTIGGHR